MKNRKKVVVLMLSLLLLHLNIFPAMAEEKSEIEEADEVSEDNTSNDVTEVEDINENSETSNVDENKIEDQVKEEEQQPSTIEEAEDLEEDQNTETVEQVISVTNVSPLNTSILKKGDKDDRVRQLKKDLAELGFLVPNTNFTRYYGPDTEKTVKKFQAYYGLDADGIAGPATFDKIESILNSPLQNGKRHRDTVTLKTNLALLGYPVPGNGTTLYGPNTEAKVKEFQADHDLVVNGIADEVTLAKIEELLPQGSHVLRKGVRHQDVVQLKKDLATLGFPVPGNGTTYFGKQTEKTVKEFQSYYGLKVTGIADETTLAQLNEIVSTPLQYGKRHSKTVQLKKDLAFLVLAVPGNGTTYYGTETRKRVRQFQEKNNLVVNGIADPVTLAKIEELVSEPMSDGVYRQDVVQLKKDLAKLGFAVPGNGTPLYGPKTEQKVKEFQKYYGLSVDGIVGSATLKKIDEILSSPLQYGKRHQDTIQLKKDLAVLGYPVEGNGTNYYGRGTEQRIKEFQSDYRLVVNGIADEITLAKIEELLSGVLKYGVRDKAVIQLKKNLARLGFEVPGNGTNYFGRQTEKKVKEFQAYYGLTVDGIAGASTLAKIAEVLSSPLQYKQRHRDTIKLKEDLAKLGYHISSTPTTLYGKQTEAKVKQFQEDNGLAVSGIAEEVTLQKISDLLKEYVRETSYNLTINQALNIQMTATPQTDTKYAWVSKNYIDRNNRVTATSLHVRTGPGTSYRSLSTISNGTRVQVLDEYNGWYAIKHQHTTQWVHASPNDVRYYLNPTNFLNDERQIFQFLDLSKPSGISRTYLDNYLKGKGALEGQGQAFIDAGREHGLNDVYLLSHAILETGNGTSTLARGVKYNGVTVYNMYGIGAYDSCPTECGAKRAFEEGWTTPKKAIIGGAKFIGNDYIKSGQNTLYKMRWNPEAMASNGRFGRQYATDIGWASKQINTMYNLYQQIGSYKLHLDIPVYK